MGRESQKWWGDDFQQDEREGNRGLKQRGLLGGPLLRNDVGNRGHCKAVALGELPFCGTLPVALPDFGVAGADIMPRAFSDVDHGAAHGLSDSFKLCASEALGVGVGQGVGEPVVKDLADFDEHFGVIIG